MKDLTFREVSEINLRRCERWHQGNIAAWSVSDWAVAMAGEAGEACNAVKKLRRVEDEIASINDPERQISSRREAIGKIGEELADTFLYLDLLAQRLGIDLAAEIRAKFNRTSERYGFPERL
jgi:NTP pyrophosphatase (non-canonical NTP hydrolase)